ncbi:hypothetical protein R1sor_012425 [Riccia sorocarpa]|uniref:Disease resistance R13L4/SHOC-2-like LRR domain-containing protein n=1 Tax=Riccia sorocarpa TaxID=122646 RepID=A0ABD3I5K4_9MARC
MFNIVKDDNRPTLSGRECKASVRTSCKLVKLDKSPIVSGKVFRVGSPRIFVNGYDQWAPGQSCLSCIVREVWPKLTAIRYMDLGAYTFRCCQNCRNRGCPLPNTLLLFQLDFRQQGDFVISGSGKNFPGERRETMVSTSTSLVHLQLNQCITVDCGGLNTLRHLRILRISRCREILNWPASLSKLKDLKQLELELLDEPFELPRTIGNLTNLEHLSLKNCKFGPFCSAVRNWPTALGELTNLKRLELESVDTPFELPDTFGALTKLEHLSINQSKVGSIPSSLRKLTSLRFLKVSEVVGSQAIPDVIRFPRQVQILHLKCWGIVNLVDVLREMTALEELHLECEGIEELPDAFGSLTSLKKLQLRCPIEWLPASFANLTRLETLKLEGRFGMVWVNKPSDMKWVEKQELYRRFGMEDSLWNGKECVVRLKEDEIVHPINPLLCHLQGFMTKQKGLHLDCQHGMSTIIVRNMIGLESLEINVRGPQAVPDIFGDLQKLLIFKLTCETMESSLVESLERLSSLEELDLVCKTVERLPDVFGCFSTLKTLRIQCPSLQALPDTFGNFVELTTLRISATLLRTLPDASAQLSQLEGCDTRTTFPDLVGCSSSLGPWEISRITRQTMWQLPRLKELKVSGHKDPWGSDSESHRSDQWRDLPETIWPHLESLRFRDLQKLRTLPEHLGNLQSLRRLEFKRCGFKSLPESLGRLSGLTSLKIMFCGHLKTLPETIGDLSSLEDWGIYCCKNLKTLPETIGDLSRLTSLRLRYTYALHSLPESVGRLSSLTTLNIPSVRTLPNTIGDLSKLSDLCLSASALLSPPHTFWDLSKHKVSLTILNPKILKERMEAELYRSFGSRLHLCR